MNTVDSIPMIHVGAVHAVMDSLQDIGVPLRRSLSDARMPTRIVDEREGYIPFKIACNWINRESRAQGIPHLGLMASLRAGASFVPADVLRRVAAAPTLYRGMRAWAEMISVISSNVSISLDEHDDYLHLRFRSSFTQEVPGQCDWIWFASAMHIGVVRLFLGPDWMPSDMVVPRFGSGSDAAQELLPNTRIHGDPGCTGLAISRHLLSTAPIAPASTARGEHESSQVWDTLEDLLGEVIRLYLPDGPPRIYLAAEAACMSVRTLQRRLAQKGLTYDEIVGKVRFEEAKNLLERGDVGVAEAGRQLGYRHAAHFTRAFGRIAGMSPSAYHRKFTRGGSLH